MPMNDELRFIVYTTLRRIFSCFCMWHMTCLLMLWLAEFILFWTIFFIRDGQRDRYALGMEGARQSYPWSRILSVGRMYEITKISEDTFQLSFASRSLYDQRRIRRRLISKS